MTWGLYSIKSAYDKGEAMGATHMIVSHDSLDFENTATYIMPGENPREAWEASQSRNAGYSAVDEVYAYHLGWEAQSKERRARHWEEAPNNEE